MIEALIAHKITYIGMFSLLAGAGIVAPVPEEITLLVAGYFVALGFMDLVKVIPLAIIAILIGDSILFFLARTGSRYAKGVHTRLITYGLEKTWIFSPTHPLRAVFILRFFTGLRMIAPVFAGFNGATWIGFLLTDLAALVIFVPIIVSLGFYFSQNFLEFLGAFEIIRHILFWSIIAFVGGEVLSTVHPSIRKWMYKLFRISTPRTEHDTPHE